MKFGHYWPKDPAKEKVIHIEPFPMRYELIWQAMPVLKFEPFPVRGDDGRSPYSRPQKARAVQQVWDAAMGGVSGTVRHLP